jgi:quercetin dioxygenase-like cupin family protein
MQITSLSGLAEQHLTIARQASSGRSAHTVYGGQATRLRQTLLALADGRRLDEHDSPGEATLHVLHGHVRLIAGPDVQDATAGDLLIIPARRHALEAVQDSVVLLTVAIVGGP